MTKAQAKVCKGCCWSWSEMKKNGYSGNIGGYCYMRKYAPATCSKNKIFRPINFGAK